MDSEIDLRDKDAPSVINVGSGLTLVSCLFDQEGTAGKKQQGVVREKAVGGPTRPGKVVPTSFCAHPSGYRGGEECGVFDMDYRVLAAVAGAKIVPATKFISGFKPLELVAG